MGAKAPRAPFKLNESGRLKFSPRSPGGRLNMEFSFPSNLSDDLNLLKKSIKKSFFLSHDLIALLNALF